MTTNIRTYSELSKLQTFQERYEYLRLGQVVGDETFGYDRYLNQIFYHSPEWKEIRRMVILRDQGCDLGLEGHEIYGRIIVHHMNPILLRDIVHRESFLLNPEYLISTSHSTHEAITYGDENLLPIGVIDRNPGDTTLWRKQ